MEYISHNLETTHEVAKEFLKTLSPLRGRATIIELIGDLGAGKTTFTKSLAEELGVGDTVISPTFVIQKRYSITNHPHFKTLIHIDAYRFETQEEIKALDLEQDIQNGENLILIEWPSKIQNHIPESIKLNFEHVNETTRKIWW